MPVKSPRGLMDMVWALRSGNYDMAISLVRSPLMSLAVGLSGIPVRAGISSGWRGFGYTHKASTSPDDIRHESLIYLDVVKALGIDTENCYANLPAPQEDQDFIADLLPKRGIDGPYLIVNPAGGSNPGMAMHSKRWPSEHFAQVADTLAAEFGWQVILLAGPEDSGIVNAVRSQMQTPVTPFIGELSFAQIAALTNKASLYIGNDTGLSHIAAASGAPTVTIFGPSDPARYAPYTPRTLALWKPTQLHSGGVQQTHRTQWDWARDGIGPDEALSQIRDFLNKQA
jgi:ADP-heptose:LPS heptosyltransferase